MGDARFEAAYAAFAAAPDRAAALRGLEDEDVVEALAAASRHGEPLLANVLATEALNRIRRLRASLAHLGEGVVTLDPAGRVQWANPAAERLLGRPRADMMGRDFERLVEREGEWFHRSDGSSFCVEAVSAPILSPDGERQGTVVAFSDCTERKRAQEALEVSEQRYRSLFEHSPDAVVTLALDGVIVDANAAAERLTGVPVSQARGRSFREFVHPADVEETLRLFAEVVAGHPRRTSLRVLRADGTDVLTLGLGVPVVVAGNVVGVHGVVRPITPG